MTAVISHPVFSLLFKPFLKPVDLFLQDVNPLRELRRRQLLLLLLVVVGAQR